MDRLDWFCLPFSGALLSFKNGTSSQAVFFRPQAYTLPPPLSPQVPGKKLRVHCGSPSYAAPEIVSRQLYDGPPVDVWSLGVVLFAMITGYLPFHASGSNKDELCQKIIAGVYKTPEWISDESKDLLRGMLTTDPRRRLTLEQVSAFLQSKVFTACRRLVFRSAQGIRCVE